MGHLEPGPNAVAHNLGAMAKAADFFLRTPTLTASSFAALWFTNLKFLALKDLNLLKKFTKNEETCSFLKADFALSKSTHLHRAYLLTLRKQMSMTVSKGEYLHLLFELNFGIKKSLKLVAA